MKCFRQLLRQPIKFIAGLVLMTVAAAIACICVGQALAAWNTAKELDEQFTTVALPKGMGGGGYDENAIYQSEVAQTDAIKKLLKNIAQSNPETVKSYAEHGFLSASIPELTPLNYTQGNLIAENFSGGNPRLYDYDPEPAGTPYTGAMLVITLEEVTEPMELIVDGRFTLSQADSVYDFGSERLYQNAIDNFGENKLVAGYQITLSGTITEVISLQEGFRDPVGMTARLDISLPTVEELDALDLEVGQSYLVYGVDYYDEDWAFRGYLADERNYKGAIVIDAFDLRNLYYYTEAELERLNQPDSGIVARYSVITSGVQASDSGIPKSFSLNLSFQDCDRINSVSMTLWEDFRYSSVEDFESTYFHSPYVDRRPNVTYTDWDGNTVTMTWEEYTERYQIPTFTRLEGSVEDFLQSEEGEPWREALERDEVNNHAFAILGVERAMYLADFAKEISRITEGRDFTAEEVKRGDRVCIVNEAVAAASGLEIGDTVTLSCYHGDNGLPYQNYWETKDGLVIPSADFYFDTTPILETAEYTIVGLWSSPDLWPDIALNEYALSPNTVIVPKSSAETAWEHPDSILYATIVLHNGKIGDFRELIEKAGFYNAFTYFDQGYTELVGNFHDFEALSFQVLTVGAVVYAVILLLFLLLYPTAQRKAVGIMESLGAPVGKRFNHVMLSSVAIIGPATVLGGGVGMLLWQRVLDALQASAETTVALQLEAGTLLLIALAQFALAMVLTAIIAAFMTAPKALTARKSK